jgi:hypothetical protein
MPSGAKNESLPECNIGTFGTVLETKCSGSEIATDFALTELQTIPAIIALLAGPMLGMIPALPHSRAG